LATLGVAAALLGSVSLRRHLQSSLGRANFLAQRPKDRTSTTRWPPWTQAPHPKPPSLLFMVSRRQFQVPFFVFSVIQFQYYFRVIFVS
jgi:hypothetical protein